MNLSKLKIAVVVAGLALTFRVSAQTVLSDFSDLQNDGTVTFLDTWYQSPDDQYTQNPGYITIEPKGSNGGNPTSVGSFQVGGVSLDLTAYSSIQVSAREGAGNFTGTFNVVFYNTSGINLGPSSYYTFNASDFSGGSFQSQSISIGSGNSENGFDPTAVTIWSIEGDYTTDPGPTFRFDFNNLQLTPVPEPTTLALLGLGVGAFAFQRLRRRG